MKECQTSVIRIVYPKAFTALNVTCCYVDNILFNADSKEVKFDCVHIFQYTVRVINPLLFSVMINLLQTLTHQSRLFFSRNLI